MVHGLFTDLPKFKDVRNSLARHATNRFPRVSMANRNGIALHHALVRLGLAGTNAEGYARYHVHTNGWPGIGYHYVIEGDGTIKFCNELDIRGAHIGNSNPLAIGICLSGDFRFDKITQEQAESLRLLIQRLQRDYKQLKEIKPHNAYPGYSWKECCVFDYEKILSESKEVFEETALGNTYTIQEGDTFWSIAKGRDFEVIDLEHANPDVNPTQLQIGQKINIPTKEADKATEEEKQNPIYKGNSITRFLESIGEDSSFNARKRQAEQLGIRNYTGTAGQNLELLSILRDGKAPKNNNVAELLVDGSWGPATTRRLQQVLGTPADGVISGQPRNAITNNIHSVRFGSGGSLVVRAMQRKLGVTIDGFIGPVTTRALQRRMGTPVTGAISRTNSAVVRKLQVKLNKNRF